MELHLKITGVILVVLACLHAVFPRYFRWREELAPLSLINRQLMYVHTFFIALMLLLMGVFCMAKSNEIVTTSLGHTIALNMFLFWLVRLFFQLFVYSAKLWKGKRLETTIHILFTLLWLYFSIVFFTVWQIG